MDKLAKLLLFFCFSLILSVESTHRVKRGLGDIIGGLLPPTTTGMPNTTTASVIEVACNQPIVGGVVCKQACGAEGGTCNLGKCWCNCRSVLKNITDTGTAVIGLQTPNCTGSSTPQQNADCNSFCDGYGMTGSMCNTLGLLGTPASDICTCKCNPTVVVIDNPTTLSDICSTEGANTAVCQTVCGPLGGTCDGGTCFCTCPSELPLGLNADALLTSSCPTSMQIHKNDDFQASCDVACGVLSTSQEVCSLVPSNIGLLSHVPLLGALLQSIYSGLVEQTKLCVCRFC